MFLELAIVIKWLYQFRSDKEYEVFTIGVTEKLGGIFLGCPKFYLKPNLYFFIGNKESLKPLENFKNQYINNDLICRKFEDLIEKGLIRLPLNSKTKENEQVKIECLTGFSQDKRERINYYNYLNAKRQEIKNNSFSSNFQVFKNSLGLAFNYGKFTGIKDVLSFDIDSDDDFIANVLISICIYKRNNGIEELTNDDYKHIFEVLFNESLDMSKEIEKGITRNLQYIPSRYEKNL